MHNDNMTAAIPTRTVRLLPWIKTSGVEACFPTQRGGAPVSIISGLLTGTTHFGLLGGKDYHGNGDRAVAIIHVAPEGSHIEYPPNEGPEPTDKESVVTIVNFKTGERTQVQVLDENATPLPFRNAVQCRAGTAVCWTKDSVYRFTLESLLAA
jgi:hypothetical protein